MATITVNGKSIEADENALLIDVLDKSNVYVPRFCYHKSLGTDGNCRMCMVKIEGQKRPQIACDTPIKDGMVVQTKDNDITAISKKILELELINHPVDCPTCDQAGECSLQDYYMKTGLYGSRMDVEKVYKPKNVKLNENVVYDGERCVVCTRCVRFTKQISGSKELTVLKRTDKSYISLAPNSTFKDPYSMNVVDLCPVGALTSGDFRFHKRVWFLKNFKAICNGCSRGCNIRVDHSKDKYGDDIIYRYKPRENQKINNFFMCDEGRLSYKKENYAQQIIEAQVENESVSQEEALDKFLELISNTKTTLLASSHLSNEELDFLNKFSKTNYTTINGYSEQYIEESFKDDFLKTNDKSPNRIGLEWNNIPTSLDDLKANIKNADTVVVFENNFFEKNRSLLKGKKSILFASYKDDYDLDEYDIVIPIASFMQKNGTYVNIDRIEQEVTSTLDLNDPKLDIKTLLKKHIKEA